VTALVLALLCGSLAALQSNHQLLGGVLLGILSFKPQYVPFLALLLVVQRCWLAVAAATTVILIHYALGAAFVSPRWPLDLIAALATFGPLDWAENSGVHFSLPRFFGFAVGAVPGQTLSWLAIGVVYVGYAWFARSATVLGFQPLTLWTVALFARLCWLGACSAARHCASDSAPKRS
jgi:hypothetical protein